MGQKSQKKKIRLPTLSARVRVRRWIMNSEFDKYQSPFNSLKNVSIDKRVSDTSTSGKNTKYQPLSQPNPEMQPKPNPKLQPKNQPGTEPQLQPKPKRKRRKKRAPSSPNALTLFDFPGEEWGLERFRPVLGGEYFELNLFLAGLTLLVGEYVVINAIRYYNGQEFYF